MRTIQLPVENLEGKWLREIVVFHVSVNETAWISTRLGLRHAKLFYCGVSGLNWIGVKIEELIPARNPEAVEIIAQGGRATSLHAHDK